jgi:hypothetical protein
LTAADKYASLDDLDKAIAQEEADVVRGEGVGEMSKTGGRGGMKGPARDGRRERLGQGVCGEEGSDSDESEGGDHGQGGGLRKNSFRWGDKTKLSVTGRAALGKSGRQGNPQQQEQQQQKHMRGSGGGGKPVPFLKGPLHLAQLQPPPQGLEVVGKRVGKVKHPRLGDDDLQASYGKSESVLGESLRVEVEGGKVCQESRCGEEGSESEQEGLRQQLEQQEASEDDCQGSARGQGCEGGEEQGMHGSSRYGTGRVVAGDSCDSEEDDSDGEGHTRPPGAYMGEAPAHYLDSVHVTVADEVDVEQLKGWSTSAAPSRQLSGVSHGVEGGEGKGEPKLLQRSSSGSSSGSSMIGADRGDDDDFEAIEGGGGKKFKLRFQIRSLGGSGGLGAAGAGFVGEDGTKQGILSTANKTSIGGVDPGSMQQLQTGCEEEGQHGQQQGGDLKASHKRSSAVRQSRASYLSWDEGMEGAQSGKVGCQCVTM